MIVWLVWECDVAFVDLNPIYCHDIPFWYQWWSKPCDHSNAIKTTMKDIRTSNCHQGRHCIDVLASSVDVLIPSSRGDNYIGTRAVARSTIHKSTSAVNATDKYFSNILHNWRNHICTCALGGTYTTKKSVCPTQLCWLQEEHANLTFSAQISKIMKLFDNLQLFVDIWSDQAVECGENGRNTLPLRRVFLPRDTQKLCSGAKPLTQLHRHKCTWELRTKSNYICIKAR